MALFLCCYPTGGSLPNIIEKSPLMPSYSTYSVGQRVGRKGSLRYLIWKMPHYVTSYHQDTHVPPHFTVYNQAPSLPEGSV